VILDYGFVFPEHLPDFEILRFRGALDAVDVRVAGHAETHQQVVFQADQEP